MFLCCCQDCQLFFDDFTRGSIGSNWEFGSATYPSSPSSWSGTPDGWSISSDQLTCSTAGKVIRPIRSAPGPAALPFDWDLSGLVTELDFTYTGSGQLHIDDVSFRFDETPKRVDLRRNDGVEAGDPPRYEMPFSLVSGDTYSLRVVNSSDVPTAPASGNVEVWLNGTPLKKTNIVNIRQGEMSLTGSGSVVIDNYRLTKIWGPDFPHCEKKERGFFPWSDAGTRDYPSQLQIDVSGTNYSGCHPVSQACRINILSNTTYLLDWIDPATCWHASNGFFALTPFAAYTLSGTFGSCYDTLEIVFLAADQIGAFSGPLYEYVRIAFYNSASPSTHLPKRYEIRNVRTPGGDLEFLPYYGTTMDLNYTSPTCWWANLVMTPVY